MNVVAFHLTSFRQTLLKDGCVSRHTDRCPTGRPCGGVKHGNRTGLCVFAKLSLGNGFTNELTTKFGKCDETSPCEDSSKKKFTLELTTDQWGSETSFLVKRRNANGKFKTNVFSGNNFESSTDYTLAKCLPQSGCYKLIVRDSASDGICCETGNGSFQGYWKGDEVPNKNAQFLNGNKSVSTPFGNC